MIPLVFKHPLAKSNIAHTHSTKTRRLAEKADKLDDVHGWDEI
jgi:hypothetical protein